MTSQHRPTLGRRSGGGRGRPGALLLLVFVALSLVGCEGCRGTTLATLAEKQGSVERDYARRIEVWQTADVGAAFSLGDAVQTLGDASAILRLEDGSQLSLEPETRIRFSDQPPRDRTLAFNVETGTAALQTGAEGVSIQTRVGLAQIESGSTVVLTGSEGGLRFLVQVGNAVFGDSRSLAAGQGVDVAQGGAIVAVDDEAEDAPPPIGAALADSEPKSEIRADIKGSKASISADGVWESLDEGVAQLAPGTRIRVQGSTRVDLSRDDQRAALAAPGEYVAGPEAGVLVRALSGSVEAGSLGVVRVAVPGGVVVVAAEGRARVRATKSDSQVEVRERQAVVEGAAGRETLVAGQVARLSRKGEIEVQGRSLPYADIEVDVGQSLVVHDPTPPTAVRFSFSSICAGRGRVDLLQSRRGKTFAVGEGTVTLSMQTGSYGYRLRCAGDDETRGKGRVRILRDTGTRRMVARPPSTEVVADGRLYTVLYQTRLPRIALSWRGGEKASDLKLTHEPPGKPPQSIPLGEPSHVFEPGELREGRHVFYFQGGGKLSRRTPVEIAFDNAAPTATLNTPHRLSARPGEAVTISGAVLPGWKVEVEGERPTQDRQGRFSLPAVLPTERRALAVWLSHPSRGMHVYLRRGRQP